MKGVIYSALATLVGLAMVGGGIYGLVHTYTDDDDDSSSASVTVPNVSSPVNLSSIGAVDSCEEIDPRLKFKDLPMVPVKSEGEAVLHVRCGGGSAFFGIEVTGADNAEDYLYAELWAYNSTRDATKLGTAFYRGGEIDGIAALPPNVDLTKYDSLVLVSRAIEDNSNKPKPIAFKADL